MKAKKHIARVLLYSLLLVAMMALTAPVVWAQGGGDAGEGSNQANQNRSGTGGAVELLVPLTARYTALGSSTTSGLADMNGLEALYANPAGLTSMTGTSIIFSRMEYVADIGVNYFGVGQSFGNNNLAFTIAAWDFGNIPLQTETAPEISDVTFDVSFITAGLSYARALTDRIAVGTTIKLISESIDDMEATGVALDAGMTYVVGESGLRLGVSLKNIGNALQYSGTGLIRQVQLPGQPGNATNNAVAIESEGVELPTLLNFGAAYTRQVGAGATLTVLGNFRSNSFDQDQYSGGLELGFQEIVYLRGGIELTQDSDLTFFQGYSFGAGLNLNLSGTRLTLDYALVPTDFFDNVQFITASVTL